MNYSLWKKLRKRFFYTIIPIWKRSKLRKNITQIDGLLQVVRKCLKKINYCFLITHSDSNQINSRVLQPFPLENDFSIYFGTDLTSRKVQEIQQNQNITISYINHKKLTYITLLGRAHIENNFKLKQKYWRDEWIGFFPEGPENETYTLIKFIPEKIELVSFAYNVTPKPFGLKPAILIKQRNNWIIENK